MSPQAGCRKRSAACRRRWVQCRTDATRIFLNWCGIPAAARVRDILGHLTTPNGLQQLEQGCAPIAAADGTRQQDPRLVIDFLLKYRLGGSGYYRYRGPPLHQKGGVRPMNKPAATRNHDR